MKQRDKVIGLLILALIVSAGHAEGQELRAGGAGRTSGTATSEPSRKVVSRLRGLMADFRAQGITAETAPAKDVAKRFSSAFLKVDEAGRVQVDVAVTDASEPSLDALRAHGLDIEIVNREFMIIQGWVPVEKLEALAGEGVVKRIRPPSYGRSRKGAARQTRTGSVNSQGDVIHRCDQARAMGYTGAGVKVGVVSDGVDGLAESQSSSNLGSVEVLNAGSGDEGTAILEIIADCAPGAALAFSPGTTSLAFINSVNALQAAGARIIVDDIGFFDEPYFEDGLVARNDRVAGGAVLRVSAGGNDALGHYQAGFSPGPIDTGAGTRHNFGGGDTRLRFLASPGLSLIFLQWGNRFGAAADDYDLYVFQANTDELVTGSILFQNGDDDPIESVEVGCDSPAGCVGDLQISLFAGAARPLKLFCLGCDFDQFNTSAGSIFGHPAAPEVLAIAAAPADAPTTLEPFSSRGDVTILFPSPEVRSKPDLTGIDGVSTSRPDFNPFFGTSAAAPHVAGVAALVAEANPSYGLGPPIPSLFFANALRDTAMDLGMPGRDPGFGSGLADALTAVQAEEAKARCQILSNRSTVPVGQRFTVTVNTFPGAGDPWDIYVVGRVTIGNSVTFFSLDLATGGLGPADLIQRGRPTAPITESSQSFGFVAPIVAHVDAFCVFVDPAVTRINRLSVASIAFTP
ncbi:MAG: S8 family peptidase [Candidatus Rokuibacteriota bacterium]